MRLLTIILGRGPDGSPFCNPIFGLVRDLKDASAVMDLSGWEGFSYMVEGDEEVDDPLLPNPKTLDPLDPKEPHTVYVLGLFLQLN